MLNFATDYMCGVLPEIMAGSISGANICIDGGMTKLMIYHNDNGWKLEE